MQKRRQPLVLLSKFIKLTIRMAEALSSNDPNFGLLFVVPENVGSVKRVSASLNNMRPAAFIKSPLVNIAEAKGVECRGRWK